MNDKFVNFGVGWVRQTKDGSNYISAVVGGRNLKVKQLKAVLDSGEEVEVSKFAVYWNKEKQTDKSPDVRLTFINE
jgi:acylphosphatase